MGEWLEISAKTTDDAVTEALIKLGTTSDKVEYEILEKESRGFLGFGSRLARIRARVREEEKLVEAKTEPIVHEEVYQEEKIQTPPRRTETLADENKFSQTRDSYVKKEERNYYERSYRRDNRNSHYDKGEHDYKNPYSSSSFKTGPTEKENESVLEEKERNAYETKEIVKIENVEELKQDAERFLSSIFETMNMQAQMEISFHESETTIMIDLKGEDMGILIGKRGQTLDSLQYLVSLVVNRKSNSYVKVKLDTENYRDRRKETLENLAKNIAFKVKRTKRPVTLEPMNPYERRIIHSALQHDKFVETHSEGEEPYRKIVVTLKRNNRDYGNRRGSYRRDYNNNYKRDYNNYKKARQTERESEKQQTSEE